MVVTGSNRPGRGCPHYSGRVAQESRKARIQRARGMNLLLAQCYPGARAELDFTNPFELLVATVLSAQSTDKRVNQVTKELFRRWPTPETLSTAERGDLEDVVHPTGFFRAKTDSLLRLSTELVDRFDSQVPQTLDELVTLPGVGRKTANVVLGNAMGVPGLTPDTHFIRVTGRMGWTEATKPDDVERDVALLFEPDDWVQLSHNVIWHGRRRCHARNPACGACPVAELCPSYGEGPIDPTRAQKLIREPRK